jgi:G3E family GTPase
MTPIHIISGFLGAGKTTAIIELLKRKTANEQWAIVINEFGKISIDGKTLSAEAEGQSLFEISGGCICCSAKAYFLEDMEKIIRIGRFDRIIVEPSGLGGTDHITELAAQHAGLRLMPVVCLVDITMTANPRLKMLPIYQSQILKAELVLFSKFELLKEQELIELTEKFKVDFPGKKCQLKTQFDFEWSFKTEERIAARKDLPIDLRPWSFENKHSCKEFCLTLPPSKKVNIQELKEILENEKSILRAKGYIYSGKEWLLFNYTLSGVSTEVCLPGKFNELAIIFESTANLGVHTFGKEVERLFKNA